MKKIINKFFKVCIIDTCYKNFQLIDDLDQLFDHLNKDAKIRKESHQHFAVSTETKNIWLTVAQYIDDCSINNFAKTAIKNMAAYYQTNKSKPEDNDLMVLSVKYVKVDLSPRLELVCGSLNNIKDRKNRFNNHLTYTLGDLLKEQKR